MGKLTADAMPDGDDESRSDAPDASDAPGAVRSRATRTARAARRAARTAAGKARRAAHRAARAARREPRPPAPAQDAAFPMHGDVRIDDIAPHRTHDFGDLLHAAAAVILAALVMVSGTWLHGLTSGVERDVRDAGHALPWLADLPASMLLQLATIVIVLSTLVQLLVSRQWLQTVVAIVAMFAGYGAAWAVSAGVTAFGPPPLLSALLSPSTAMGTTLLPDFFAGIAALLSSAGPRRTRSTVRWGWNLLYAVSVLLVVLSWYSVCGVLVSLATGRLVGMLARFAAGAESQGAWGGQVVDALRSIGVDVTALERRRDADDAGSLRSSIDDDLVEGSRLYDATDRAGRRYVVSVLDSQVRAAGYLRQLWQWIRLTGVPMRRDRSGREATQHHLSMLLGLKNAGLPVPEAYGIADAGESSVLVLRGTDTLLPCNLATMDDGDAVAFLRYLSVANRRGYTHRRITPQTLARLEGGTPIIAGWQNGDDSSTWPNVALDRVQLLALIAAILGPERAIAAARRTWGDETLVRITPFMQKAAVPAATRSLPGWGRDTVGALRDGLKALDPEESAETAPVTLTRFGLRSFVGMALLVVAAAVVFTQLKPDEIIAAVREANPLMALGVLVLSVVAWLGQAAELGAFVDRSRRDVAGLVMSQAATGFAVVSMPAGVGPAFVNLQYLRHIGYRGTAATAITSAVLAVYYGGTLAMILLVGLFTGRNALSDMIPANTLVIVIGAVALVAAAAMMVPPVRRLVMARLLPLLRTFVRQLADVLSRPRPLAASVAGMIVLNVATAMGFWVALLAFGHRAGVVETVFLFLLANAVGSAVPTPGGLGGVEAALTFAFTSAGVPAGVALSATLLYRVAFYWLRIPAGALAMRWLDRRGLV